MLFFLLLMEESLLPEASRLSLDLTCLSPASPEVYSPSPLALPVVRAEEVRLERGDTEDGSVKPKDSSFFAYFISLLSTWLPS